MRQTFGVKCFKMLIFFILIGLKKKKSPFGNRFWRQLFILKVYLPFWSFNSAAIIVALKKSFPDVSNLLYAFFWQFFLGTYP